MNSSRILWQRLDLPGHEICALEPLPKGWQMEGTALVAYGALPSQLNYRIECDVDWRTRSVTIRGRIGEESVSLDVTRSEAGTWHSNGEEAPAVEGCIDVDMEFSPSTNLLPVRRLKLAIGDRAVVRAAWVRFPQLSLEPLDQVYTRLGVNHYLYESGDGAFRRELRTNGAGFVTDYPGYWRSDASYQVKPGEKE